LVVVALTIVVEAVVLMASSWRATSRADRGMTQYGIGV
jgi:hypothetical protein